jgi:hypothetical protein
MPNALNHGQLRTRFLELLNRTDCTPALADNFIFDAINRIYRDLRVPSMERRATLTAQSDGSFRIPTDFIELRDITDSAGSEFRGTDPDGIRALRKHPNLGYNCEVHYARQVNVWITAPLLREGTTVEIVYYADPGEITADTDVIPPYVWAPELVKYGALIFAADYFLDDRQVRWAAIYAGIKQEIEDQAEMEAMYSSNQSVHQSFPDDDY